MKKTNCFTKTLAVFLTVLMLLSVAPFGELAGLDLGFKLKADAVSGYSAGGAAEWAKQHCDDYNSVLLGTGYWNDGGDCANFVSQCLYMGGIDMDGYWNTNGFKGHWTEPYGWDYAGSFARCVQLYNFLVYQKGGEVIHNPAASQVDIGDVLIYYNPVEGRFGHSAIVTDTAGGTPEIAYHSDGTERRIIKDWHLGFSGNDTYLIKMHGSVCVNQRTRSFNVYIATGGDLRLYWDSSTGSGVRRTFYSGEYAHVYSEKTVDGVRWGYTFRYGDWGWIKLNSFQYTGHYETPSVSHLFGAWQTVQVANCQQDGLDKRVCTRCGYTETRTTKGGHITDPHATCTTEGICKVCGAVTEAPLGHIWDEGYVSKSPTCIDPGDMLYHCERDRSHKYTEEGVVPALGHDYLAVPTAPSCVNDGDTITYECSRCGDRYLDYADPDNTWSGWTMQTPEEVCLSGDRVQSKNQYRSRTKRTKTSTEPDLEGWTLSSTTYEWTDYGDWSAWSTTPAYESDSRKVETRSVTRTQYNYSRYAQYSNGTGVVGPVAGYWGSPNLVYCQYYFERGWTDSNLSIYMWQDSNQAGTFACYNNADDGWFNERTQQVFDHTEYRYCDRTQYPVYHYYRWNEWSAWQDDPITVSWLETSYKEVEERTLYRYDLARLGHDFSLEQENSFMNQNLLLTDEQVNETCFAHGYICSRCGVLSPDSVSVPHDIPDFETERDLYEIVTGDDASVTVYKGLCRNGCGCYVLKTVDNHNYVVKEIVPPTCNGEHGTEGYTIYRCTYHGEEYSDDFVPALEDDYSHDIWEVQTSPTCTQPGVIICKCARYDACGHYITEEIPPLGHTMTKIEAKPATCLLDGNSEYYYCAGCDKYFADEDGNTEIEADSWALPATGHSNPEDVEWTVERESRCGFAGLERKYCENEWCDEKFECDVCDGHGVHGTVIDERETPAITPIYYVFDAVDAEYDADYESDNEFEKWISTTCDHSGILYITCKNCEGTEYAHGWNIGTPYSTMEARILPHLPIERIDPEPLCIYPGVKHTDCERCGKQDIVEPVEIPAPYSEHDMEERQDEGCIYHVCTRCGYSPDTDAHDYQRDTSRDIAPTCTTEGNEGYTCSRCGKQEDITLPALGHDMVKTGELPATCTEVAADVYECQREGCDYTFEVPTGQPLGHDYSGSYLVTQKGTCTEDGRKALHCVRENARTGEICDAELSWLTIPARGHDMSEWIDDSASGEDACRRKDCRNTETEEYEVCSFNITEQHSWGDWTDNGDGTHVRTCANFAVHTQSGDHVYRTETTLDPTCTTPGEDTNTCSVCGNQTSTPIDPLGHLQGYKTGDIITFGSYPQSRVTDETILEQLNALELDWQSYGYYTGNHTSVDDEDVNNTEASDFMKYADITLNGKRYRAVTASGYRHSLTFANAVSTEYDPCFGGTYEEYLAQLESNRDVFGYALNEITWYLYEPLEWKVVDAESGTVLCNTVIDAQPYQEKLFFDAEKEPNMFADANSQYLIDDYSASTYRTWLNQAFYNTAFNDEEKAQIQNALLDNNVYVGQEIYEARPAIEDKVHALTVKELSDFGLMPERDMDGNPFNYYEDAETDAGLKLKEDIYASTWTDYAVSQGLFEWWSTPDQKAMTLSFAPCLLQKGYVTAAYWYYEENAFALGKDNEEDVVINNEYFSNRGLLYNIIFSAIPAICLDLPASQAKKVYPTCTESGSISADLCLRCGEVLENEVEIDPLGHDWGDWTKLNDKEHQHICKRDVSHVETRVHAWDDGVITRQPTAETAGEIKYTCETCSAVKTEPIPMKGWTVTFTDDNGSDLGTQTGATLEEAKDKQLDPTKESDAQYTYTFDHWEQVSADETTGEAEFIAVYIETLNSYEVKFLDENGDVLKTQTVPYAATATAPADPQKSDDENKHYEFSGWDKDFSNIMSDLMVTATYAGEAHIQKEVITVSATCEDEGTKEIICEKCGRLLDTQTIDPLGHDWGDWEETAAATYDACGEETRVCKRDASHIETRPTPVLTPDNKDNTDITVEKTADYNAETGEAIISLSAESKGEKIMSKDETPLDIVLVLDQSGSMAYRMDKNENPYHNEKTRLAELKTAATEFIDTIVARKTDDRIAVVGFAMGATEPSGYTMYENTEILSLETTKTFSPKPSDILTMNAAYKNAMVSVVENGEVNALLTKAINELSARGATAADLGLIMAGKIFEQNPNDDGSRRRVVVFMTDGEPTYSNGFQPAVAEYAESNAALLKNAYDATVYSVGVIGGGLSADGEAFLRAVASENSKNEKLYYSVTDGGSFLECFKSIAEDSGKVENSFDDVTLVDTLTKEFTLTETQEKTLRLNAIETLGVTNNDVTILRLADGTTQIRIAHIHPQEEKRDGESYFPVRFSFAVTANENALRDAEYATNTDNAGVGIGDETSYETTFQPYAVTVEAAEGVVYFNLNGKPFHAVRFHADDNLTAPTLTLEDTHTFSGWNIPEPLVFTDGKVVLEATIEQRDYTVTWQYDGKTKTDTYNEGDIITPPQVGLNSEGQLFDRWNQPVPRTMPASDLCFTATFVNHTHVYTETVVKRASCGVEGKKLLTCDCGSSKEETIPALTHSYTTFATENASGKTNFAYVVCENCGLTMDVAFTYTFEDASGKIQGCNLKMTDLNNATVQIENDQLRITLPIPTQMLNAETVKIYRIEEDGSKTDLKATMDPRYRTLRFTTNHFSPYSIEAAYACETTGAHSWDAGVVTKEATCAADGETTYTCLLCEGTKIEPIGKLAHTPGDWIIDKVATCKEAGSKHQICSACRQTIATQTIPTDKNNHAAYGTTLKNKVDAKCTTKGYTGDTVCNGCGTVITKGSETKALGHTAPNSKGDCGRCGTHLKDVDSGSSTPAGACKYCGQVHTGPFGWLIKFFHSILALFGLRK